MRGGCLPPLIVVTVIMTMSVVSCSNETVESFRCVLSSAENETFLGSAFTVLPRLWSEITTATSASWAPSVDASASMLLIGNDTSLPTFWMQAIPSSAASSEDLVPFFDERFLLCISFVCVGPTCNAIDRAIGACSAGSASRPGQFKFQSLKLATGSWFFTPATMTFLPLQQVVQLLGSANRFFCANVTAPLTTQNISSIRFSPKLNEGYLFHGKTVCAAVGVPFAPITVSAVAVFNSTFIENGGIDSYPVVVDAPITFRLQILSGSSQNTAATVVSSWNISVPPGAAAEVTFASINISKYIPSASITVDAFYRGSIIPSFNTLVLSLALSLTPSSVCSLDIPQQRNPPFIFTYGESWGAPVAPSATLPPIIVAVRRSDGTYCEGSVGVFSVPLVIEARVFDANGRLVSFALAGSTTATVANGLATFTSLALSSEVASHEWLWIQFRLNSGVGIFICYAFPIRVSVGASSNHIRFNVDQRSTNRFSEPGSLEFVSLGTQLPTIRLMLQDAKFRRVSAQSTSATVSVQSCKVDWPLLSTKGLSSLLPWCLESETSSLYLSGNTTVPFTNSGVAFFTGITVKSSDSAFLPHPNATASAVVVIMVGTYSMVFPIVISHPDAPSFRSIVRFPNGASSSLFTSQYQPCHAVVGTPLPPILMYLTFPNGTIDRRNATVIASVRSAGSVVRHADSVFQHGVAQLPGVQVVRAQSAVIRFTILIWMVDSATGAKIRMQHIDSGPISLVSLSTRAGFASLPYSLHFSRVRGYVTHDVLRVDVKNNSIIPTFLVDVLRSDYLVAGVEQSMRAADAPTSGPASSPSESILQSKFIVCRIGEEPSILATIQSQIENGTAEVSFGIINFNLTEVVMSCCLQVHEAPYSCTAVMLDVNAVTFENLPLLASVYNSILPVPERAGSSVPSTFLAAQTLDTNRTFTVHGEIECFLPDGSFGRCSAVSPSTVSLSFSIPVVTNSQSRDTSTSDVATQLTSGITDEVVGALGGDETLVVDGCQSVGMETADVALQVLSSSSTCSVVQAPPLSFLSSFLIYGDRTLTERFAAELWFERFGSISGVEISRLVAGPLETSVFNLDPSRQPSIHGFRVSVGILPRSSSSNAVGERRIANQILGLAPSCSNQAATDDIPSVSDEVSFVGGYLALRHGVLETGSIQSLRSIAFCDVSLLGSLAESARHCEIFEGSSARCDCFSPVLRALGEVCIGHIILINVCDHTAYCNDAAITSVCDQIQPNVALQVFYVVGGTILGLAIITALVKMKAIARFISQARYRMHHNEEHVQSKQSAASINIFS